MDKRERLMAVLHHQQPDHMPAGFWYHFGGENGRGRQCVQAHLDYYRDVDIDFIKIMSDSLGYPLRVEIDRAEDWLKVQPLPDDDPFFTLTVQRCREISRAVADECYTFYNFFSPVNIVRERDVFTPGALGEGSRMDAVARHLRERPDAVRHAMEVIAKDHLRLAERVLTEGGCLGIYQSLQGAEKGWLTAEEYAAVARPADLLLIDGLNRLSPYNILHLCSWAGDPNHLEYWQDYPSAVKNWGTGVEKMPLPAGKAFFGENTVLLGGLDNRAGHPLVSGTREEIHRAVEDLLAAMDGTPFILGADCTVPATIDHAHIRWALEALRTKA